jgi:hypothetical protein
VCVRRDLAAAALAAATHHSRGTRARLYGGSEWRSRLNVDEADLEAARCTYVAILRLLLLSGGSSASFLRRA